MGGTHSNALAVEMVTDCLFPPTLDPHHTKPCLMGPWQSFRCSGDNLYFALKVSVDYILTSNSKVIIADLGGEYFQGQIQTLCKYEKAM